MGPINHTVDSAKIAGILRTFDRRKDHEKYNTEASKIVEATAAIGSDTTLSVLLDIRKSMIDLTTSLNEHTVTIRDQQEKSQRNHSEVIAYLDQILECSRSMPVSNTIGIAGTTPAPTLVSQVYYHFNTVIKTGTILVASILLRVHDLIQRCAPATAPGNMDAMVVELKDWVSVIGLVHRATSTVTKVAGKLTMPKPGSGEYATALSIVGSPSQGRNTPLQPQHVHDLTVRCPGIMSIVEEVRLRIIACPGLVGHQRARCLASVEYPYVDTDGALTYTDGDVSTGSRAVMNIVRTMKASQRALYTARVLEQGMVPIRAANTVMSESVKPTL